MIEGHLAIEEVKNWTKKLKPGRDCNAQANLPNM
jgi:hypothetical protein